jgi:intermembrane space import and assembly protein 40
MCKGPGPDSCTPSVSNRDERDEQALDQRIAEALACPCVDPLKAGPCGELFVNTFTCYHKSRAEPKGCDCLDVSLAFAVSC